MPIIIENGKEIRVGCNKSTIKPSYKINDLNSVFSHYNKDTGLNEPIKNILKGGNENADSR